MRFINQFFLLFTLSSFLSAPAFSFEREHGTHEHGHAKLLIAMEGNTIEMEFHSPAVNIVGFEHQANSKEDKQKLADVVKRLSAKDLFVFDAFSQCKLISTNVASGLLGNKHDDDNKTTGKEQEEHHDETHSEFEVSYHFNCKNISPTKKIKVKLFSEFPSLDEVEAQVVGDTSQKLIELNKDNTIIFLQ